MAWGYYESIIASVYGVINQQESRYGSTLAPLRARHARQAYSHVLRVLCLEYLSVGVSIVFEMERWDSLLMVEMRVMRSGWRWFEVVEVVVNWVDVVFQSVSVWKWNVCMYRWDWVRLMQMFYNFKDFENCDY